MGIAAIVSAAGMPPAAANMLPAADELPAAKPVAAGKTPAAGMMPEADATPARSADEPPAEADVLVAILGLFLIRSSGVSGAAAMLTACAIASVVKGPGAGAGVASAVMEEAAQGVSAETAGVGSGVVVKLVSGTLGTASACVTSLATTSASTTSLDASSGSRILLGRHVSHLRRTFPCGHMPPPPQSLHLDMTRLCSQMELPPHSLHVCFRRP